jgi:hypothetical protein
LLFNHEKTLTYEMVPPLNTNGQKYGIITLLPDNNCSG